MKRVFLKEVATSIDTPNGPMASTLNYRQTMMDLLKTPKDPKQGATFEEMAEAIPIWQKFNAVSPDAKSIDLEDAEHGFLEECLKNAKFTQRTLEVFEMIQSVVDAEKVPPKG